MKASDMGTGWIEVSPGIYTREIPMDQRKATPETLERLKVAGLELSDALYNFLRRRLSRTKQRAQT